MSTSESMNNALISLVNDHDITKQKKTGSQVIWRAEILYQE